MLLAWWEAHWSTFELKSNLCQCLDFTIPLNGTSIWEFGCPIIFPLKSHHLTCLMLVGATIFNMVLTFWMYCDIFLETMQVVSLIWLQNPQFSRFSLRVCLLHQSFANKVMALIMSFECQYFHDNIKCDDHLCFLLFCCCIVLIRPFLQDCLCVNGQVP